MLFCQVIPESMLLNGGRHLVTQDDVAVVGVVTIRLWLIVVGKNSQQVNSVPAWGVVTLLLMPFHLRVTAHGQRPSEAQRASPFRHSYV